MKQQLTLYQQNGVASPIGRVIIAGEIRNNRALGFAKLRTLGLYSLTYITKGIGRFVDALGTDLQVRAGDLLLLFPDIAHGYGPPIDQTWDEIYIMFEGPVFDAWRDQRLLNPAQPVWHLEEIDYWTDRLRQVAAASGRPLLKRQEEIHGFLDHAEMLGKDDKQVAAHSATRPVIPSPKPFDRDAMQVSVWQICQLQQMLADMQAYQRHGSKSDADRVWLQRAYEAIDARVTHFDPAWDTVAGQLGITYAGLRKRFTQLAHTSPTKYRASRVIQRASTLLQNRKLTLKEVAEACGFFDEFHFSKRFKQLVGFSPSEYRKHLPKP